MDQFRHVIGSASETISMLPKLPVSKIARRHLTDIERQALVEEEGEASNKHKLDLAGTMYEDFSADDIARMMGM